MDEELLTIPEAAAALRVSPVTIARWLKQGRLPAYRMGPRAVRIRRDDLTVVLRPSDHADGAMAVPEEAGDDDGAANGGARPMAALIGVDERLAALRDAEDLRGRILARRKGVQLPAIDPDRGGKEKRGKRS